MSDTLIQLFAKPPVAGMVKTRLGKDIGEQSALAIYRYCLEKTLVLLEASPFDSQIWLTEPTQDTIFRDRSICYQQGRHLGERMYHSMNDALDEQNYRKVILIGSDCLDLNPQILHKVDQSLDHHRLVFIPANDGGYVLIAASGSIHETIFNHIDWGSDRVLRQSLHQAMQLNTSIAVLNSLRDIDRVEDLQHYDELARFS